MAGAHHRLQSWLANGISCGVWLGDWQRRPVSSMRSQSLIHSGKQGSQLANNMLAQTMNSLHSLEGPKPHSMGPAAQQGCSSCSIVSKQDFPATVAVKLLQITDQLRDCLMQLSQCVAVIPAWKGDMLMPIVLHFSCSVMCTAVPP